MPKGTPFQRDHKNEKEEAKKMTERQLYYRELIAHIIEKYYTVTVDLTKNAEVTLPNVRTDIIFEVPKSRLAKIKESPFPYLEEVNLFHIKAVNDRLTKNDVIQYLGELYIVGTSGRTKGKSVALTIISAEKILPNVVEGLRSKIEATDISWIQKIEAEVPAYIFTLAGLPQTEEYRFFLPFQPLPKLKEAQEDIQKIAQRRPHSTEETLFLFYLKKLQPDFYREEIEMKIDMEEIVKELCPKTLQAKENRGIASGMRKTILTVLQARFGTVSEEVKNKLETIATPEALEILAKGAATEQTLEDFKQLL